MRRGSQNCSHTFACRSIGLDHYYTLMINAYVIYLQGSPRVHYVFYPWGGPRAPLCFYLQDGPHAYYIIYPQGGPLAPLCFLSMRWSLYLLCYLSTGQTPCSFVFFYPQSGPRTYCVIYPLGGPRVPLFFFYLWGSPCAYCVIYPWGRPYVPLCFLSTG